MAARHSRTQAEAQTTWREPTKTQVILLPQGFSVGVGHDEHRCRQVLDRHEGRAQHREQQRRVAGLAQAMLAPGPGPQLIRADVPENGGGPKERQAAQAKRYGQPGIEEHGGYLSWAALEGKREGRVQIVGSHPPRTSRGRHTLLVWLVCFSSWNCVLRRVCDCVRCQQVVRGASPFVGRGVSGLSLPATRSPSEGRGLQELLLSCTSSPRSPNADQRRAEAQETAGALAASRSQRFGTIINDGRFLAEFFRGTSPGAALGVRQPASLAIREGIQP